MKFFASITEAIHEVQTTSWSLGQSDLCIFTGADTPEALKAAMQAADKAGSWAKYDLVQEDKGGWKFSFVTSSGTNALELVDTPFGGVKATYVARSEHRPEQSSVVAAFIAAGWDPDPSLAADLEDAAREAAFQGWEAYDLPTREPLRKR